MYRKPQNIKLVKKSGKYYYRTLAPFKGKLSETDKAMRRSARKSLMKYGKSFDLLPRKQRDEIWGRTSAKDKKLILDYK